MIFHMKPVADVGAGSIYGQCLTGQSVKRHQRDKLLGELARAVVVRAIGDQCGEAVCLIEGPDKVVAGGLRSGIGTVGTVRRRLRKGWISGLKSSEDFVSGNMQKTERVFPVGSQFVPPCFGST